MKKLGLLLAASIPAVAFAETTYDPPALEGGKDWDHRVNIVSGAWTLAPTSEIASGETIYYHGNDSTAQTVSKLALLAGYSYNITGGFTIDTNSDVATVAFDDASKDVTIGSFYSGSSYGGDGTSCTQRDLVVKNSQGAETIFNVNAITFKRTNNGVPATSLDVQTDLTVNVAKSFTISANGQNGNASVKVANGATLKLVGGSYSQHATTEMNVNGGTLDMGSSAWIGGTMNIDGNLNASQNMTFASGSVLNFNKTLSSSQSLTTASGKKVILQSGSKLAVNSGASLTITGEEISVEDGSTIDVGGTLTLTKSATFSNINVNNGGNMILTQTYSTDGKNTVIPADLTVKVGTVNVSGNITSDYGALKINGATLNLNEGATLDFGYYKGNGKNGRIVFLGGNINFNGTLGNTATSAEKYRIVVSSAAAKKMNINVSSYISDLYMQDGFVDIILKDDVLLEIGSLGFGVSGTFNIFNFQENSVKIDSYTTAALNAIKLYGADGELMEGTISVDSATKFLVFTASVPEPAEWAAIFGAIALGFAIYRRRK